MERPALGPTVTLDVTPEEFGGRLREIRESLNMSQAVLAKLMKVSQVTVAQYEAGSRSPNFIEVVKIANLLKVDVGEFAVIPKTLPPKRKPGRPTSKDE